MSKLTDADLDWLLSFKSGREFYNLRLKNSEVTRKHYSRWLKIYCDDIGKTPDELLRMKPNVTEAFILIQNMIAKGITVIDPTAIDQNEADSVLENYLNFDFEKAYKKNPETHPKPTLNNKIAVMVAARSFYSANKRDLCKETGRSLLDDRPEAKQNTPNIEDCVKLESAMPNRRGKFLVWFLVSCPVRVGTLKKLTWKDLRPLDDPEVPYWVYVEAKRLKGGGVGKYKKAKHIGFLTRYTVEKLEDYKRELKEKGISYNEDSPLFMAYRSNQYGTGRGSPMVNFNDALVDASIVAFPDDDNKHFCPHDFRDILSSILGKPQIRAEDKNIAKPLISHSPEGIEKNYENFDGKDDKPNSDLLALFKQCIPFLIPETTGELKAELNQQKAETEKEKEQNEKRIKVLEQRLLDNGLSINKMVTDFAQLKAMVEETERKKPEKVKFD